MRYFVMHPTQSNMQKTIMSVITVDLFLCLLLTRAIELNIDFPFNIILCLYEDIADANTDFHTMRDLEGVVDILTVRECIFEVVSLCFSHKSVF